MDKFKSIDEALNITDSEIVPAKKDNLKKQEASKINEIEKDNEELEKTISELLGTFN